MPTQQSRIRTAGFSHPQVFDKQFLLTNADSVLGALQEFKGCSAVLIGFSPHRKEPSDAAALALLLTAESGKRACIGMDFGVGDRTNEFRRPVNPDVWDLYEGLWYHAGICFGSWDEVWAFVCLVGERLCIRQVSLRYGI